MRAKLKVILLLAIFLIAAITAGCDPTAQPPANPSQPADKQQSGDSLNGNGMRLVVYHSTQDAMFIVPETVTVPKSDHPAATAVELLLAGPKNKDLVKVMPEGTKLKGISIKNRIAYVDFNDKLVKNNVGGSASEVLLVGAIVNTLTEFPEITKVQILVEGKKIDTISGHMDISEPLGRSEQIIKKSL